MKNLVLILLSLVAFAVSAFADASTYLNFTAVNGAATIKLDSISTPASINLQYSTNNCSSWSIYSIGQTIQLSSGSKVFFKALNTNASFCGLNGLYRFVMTGTIAGDGNIMSLLDATMQQTNVSIYCFNCLFSECSSLIQAPALPATTLATGCYMSMFYGCSSLTQAPALPTTTLANMCYSSMFGGCTSLAQAPALPATTLADYCYSGMFNGCTSLTQIPVLPATTLANGCYQDMFSYCTSLVQADSLPATRLSGYSYCRMFEGCSALTQAPSISATIMGSHCCELMFASCTALTQAPVLPSTLLADNCYYCMFMGCTALTQAPVLPSTLLADDCYCGMFMGCTALTRAPALPATTLTDNCYNQMFANCSSLVVNAAPPGRQWSIPATSRGTNSVLSMFSGTGGTMDGTPSLNTTYYVVSGTQVNALSNDTAMGRVEGGGLHNFGDNVTLDAIANEHYHFLMWSDGDTINPRSVMLTGDTTITAIFEIDKHTLSTNTNHCAINGLGTYNYGDTVTLTVVPDEHFYFQKWTDGIVSESRSVLVDTDKVYDVVLMADSFDIMTNAQYGSVTGDGRYGYSDLVQLTATPYEGYRFTGWSDGSEYNPYIFEAVEDVTLEAYFEEKVGVETVSESVEFYYSNGWLYNPEGVRLYVYSTEGKLMKSGEVDIDMTGLPEGVYFVRDTQGRTIKIWK